MKKTFNGKERLHLFGLEVIALISAGEKESIGDIEKHIDDSDLVFYIRNKYHDKMTNTFDDNCPYNLDDWNELFHDYSGYIQGNESRKFGIINDDDGLLLLVGLIFDIIGY